MEKRVYGYVNGVPCYSDEEFVYRARKRGPIETDEELLAFAEEVTHGWSYAGWHRTFTSFYLSDYALAEPRRSLTKAEFERLVELQKKAEAERQAAEDAREWVLVRTEYFADNSTEEVWRDKDGIEKRVMVEGPHGDLCY